MRKFYRSTEPHRTRTTIQKDELTIKEVFERFMSVKSIQGLAPKTISDYVNHFSYFMAYLDQDIPAAEMTADRLRAYIDWMVNERGYQHTTVNVRLRTMRAFLRFAHIEGYIPTPVHKAIVLLKVPQDLIESFTESEIKALLNQIDTDTYVGFRDYVMILTLLDTMVRISELLSMKRSNCDFRSGTIKLDAIDTKSKRGRFVPLSTRTSKLLSEYAQETDEFHEDKLFLTYDGRPMNPWSWRDRLTEYGEMAGIRNKRVSPHTFRHTGALLYIMNGGDPFSLQKILGHSDMSMVRRYIQMTNTDMKRQHNLYSPLRNIKL